MSDPFRWSILLGRWGGVPVRVHVTLAIFAVVTVLDAWVDPAAAVLPTMAWLLLFVLALAIHELAHAVAAVRLGVEPEPVRLWPLGNLALPPAAAAMRTPEAVVVAAAGPIVSGLIALSIAVGLYAGSPAHMVFNPFGTPEGGGAPLLADGTPVAAFEPAWFVGWFGYLNWVLFLVNLIPALPLDSGRIFRGLLEGPWGRGTRDHLVGPVTARVCAIVLGLWGLVLLIKGSPAWWALAVLALVIYTMARLETRMQEESELFDDSLFGYDFSQGYSGLDPDGPPRPPREGALRRWRRRRSEQRVLRQEAREAAEETRMDAILDKIHREGRQSLSGEEYRFLVRVSSKYKNRPRSRG
jgi:Zn-dependent protease